MKLNSLILDDFFFRPLALRAWALRQEFKDTEAPDGVIYPGIARDVPKSFLEESKRKFAHIMGSGIEVKLAGFRLSLCDVDPPHWAHTDSIMSQYLAITYLSLPEHCVGGTALVRHINGMEVNPRNAEEEAVWKRDTNELSKWLVTSSAGMAFNRCYVVPCHLFHAALPRGGFGSTSADGRLTFLEFFDCTGG